MILDALYLFDTVAAITASAGTQASTNVLDLSQQRDMGIGDNPALKLAVQVVTAFSTTNSGVLTVALQGSTNNSNWTTMLSSLAAITPGALTAGARLFDVDMPRPVPGQAVPRYLRLLYTVGVGVFSAGSVTSALVIDRQDNYSYPPGIGITN